MPAEIVRIAIDENVDIIGLSSLPGNHMAIVPEVMQKLRKAEADNIHVVLGGIVPPSDLPKLRGLGVVEVFSPGTTLGKIVHHRSHIDMRRM